MALHVRCAALSHIDCMGCLIWNLHHKCNLDSSQDQKYFKTLWPKYLKQKSKNNWEQNGWTAIYDICNVSLETSSLPEHWKVAKSDADFHRGFQERLVKQIKALRKLIEKDTLLSSKILSSHGASVSFGYWYVISLKMMVWQHYNSLIM